MKLLIYISLLVVCLVLNSLAAAIPFNPIRGLVEADVIIDGRIKGKFGIDTGADHLYIDKTFASRNGLKVGEGAPQRGVTGADGVSDASTLNFRSLEIGGQRLYNLTATAIDMNALIADKRFGLPDGLIGYEILQRFYVTVDYPQQKMELQMSQPSFLRTGNFDIVPFETKRHFIMVDVTFDDSITVPMVLDYCASQVFVSPALAKRLGMNTQGQRRTRVRKVTLDNKITTNNVVIYKSNFSRLLKQLRGVRFDGILGAGFLYQHKITIDYKRNRILRHKQYNTAD